MKVVIDGIRYWPKLNRSSVQREPFGAVIKWYRHNSKLTLDTVCAETGVSKSNLSDLENGKTPDPRISTVIKLAEYYGFDVDCIAPPEAMKDE